MEKTKKSQNSALAVLAMLVAILVVIFFIVPKVSAIKDLSNQEATKGEELKAGQAKVEAIKQFAMVLKTAKSDIDKLGVSIPTEEKADEAVLQVASAASAAGVSLTSVSISSSTAAAPVAAVADGAQQDGQPTGKSAGGVVSLTVSAKGNYSAMIDYLKKLEENIRPITLKSLSIATSEAGSDVDGNYTLDLPYVQDADISTSPLANETTVEVNNAK